MSAAIPTENPFILNLQDSYGAILIGIYLTTMIWGATTLQTFLYYLHWESDSWDKKVLVGFLWVTDTVNTGLMMASVWPVLIAQWGKVANLAVTRPELIHHGWVSAIVAFGVQMFFIHRIYVFGKKRWMLPAFLTILALYQVVCIIPYDIVVFGANNSIGSISAKETNDIAISLRSASAAVDVIIAIAMLYLVNTQGVGAYAGTQRMIFRITLVTINTGLWTAVVAVADLLMLAIQPKELNFTILEFPISTLYLSTLLANLNSRKFVRGGRSETLWNEPSTSHLGRSVAATGGRDTSFHLNSLGTRQGAEETKFSEAPSYITSTETRVDYEYPTMSPTKGSFQSGPNVNHRV